MVITSISILIYFKDKKRKAIEVLRNYKVQQFLIHKK